MGKLCKPKFVVSLLVLLGFAVHAATAAAISFQIIQHDQSQERIRSASKIVENTFFDYMFDQGNIVTNIPTAVSFSESEDKALVYKALDESLEGFCQYFISLTMEYDTTFSSNPEAILLKNIKEIQWAIFDAKTGVKLSSGKKEVGKVKSSSDDNKGVAALSRSVATEVNKYLLNK